VPPLSAWQRLFAERVSARPLALCRMGLGLASLLRAYPGHAMLRAVLDGSVVRAKELVWLPDPPLEWAWALTATWMLASVTFAAGFFTRTSGAVLTGALFYRLLLDRNLYASNLYLMAVLALLLTVADAGAWASLDNRVWRRPERDAARWSTVLVRIQICLVYLFSGLSKLNARFLAGEAFQHTRLAGLAPEILVVLAVATVALELILPWALWVTRLRRWAVSSAVLFHLAIVVCMERLFMVTMIGFGTMMVMTFSLYWEDGGPLGRARGPVRPI
jgi:hypothetical protein